jgi:hypothetical protein
LESADSFCNFGRVFVGNLEAFDGVIFCLNQDFRINGFSGLFKSMYI